MAFLFQLKAGEAFKISGSPSTFIKGKPGSQFPAWDKKRGRHTWKYFYCKAFSNGKFYGVTQMSGERYVYPIGQQKLF